jgi:hypothetical protein
MLIEDIAGRWFVYYFGWSGAVVIESRIEKVCEFCLCRCESLKCVTIESNSKLHRIDESAFAVSGLTAVIIPSSVEVLCKTCFSHCISLISVTFERNSKLREVAEDSFAGSLCHSLIEYPPSLYEQSQAAVPEGVRALCLSIADDECPFGHNPSTSTDGHHHCHVSQ